jgi:RimJ/RimL family protein N-acetyltransferase
LPTTTDATGRLANLDSFVTDRHRAERLTLHHLDELRHQHPDEAVMAGLGGPKTVADTESYLVRNLAHWAEHGFGLWIVYPRDDDMPIGRAVLRHLVLDDGGAPEIEVGYAFYEPWWGQGFATEVTLACLDLGFRRLLRESIVAVTSPDNASSQHVLTKCGLVFERPVMVGGAPMSLFRIYSHEA